MGVEGQDLQRDIVELFGTRGKGIHRGDNVADQGFRIGEGLAENLFESAVAEKGSFFIMRIRHPVSVENQGLTWFQGDFSGGILAFPENSNWKSVLTGKRLRVSLSYQERQRLSDIGILKNTRADIKFSKEKCDIHRVRVSLA